MSEPRRSLHDHPGLFPHLPGADVDEEHLAEVAPEGSEFRTAWEYRLSHDLTDSEGSAFWHGVYAARRSDRPAQAALRAAARHLLTTATEHATREASDADMAKAWDRLALALDAAEDAATEVATDVLDPPETLRRLVDQWGAESIYDAFITRWPQDGAEPPPVTAWPEDVAP